MKHKLIKASAVLLFLLLLGMVTNALLPTPVLASEPFLGEIKIFSFGFIPKGWAACNGQLLPINQNQALFSILGTTYGGNGTTNFALPDLRGRLALHMGDGLVLGQKAGEEFHTLTTAELSAHVHNNASTAVGTTATPAQGTTDKLALAQTLDRRPVKIYGSGGGAGMYTNAGGSQPHENRQPYLVLNYGIALQGIFPSQN